MKRAPAALALVVVLALGPGRARADTPVNRPEATDVDRDVTPPGRVEFGFDGGAPVDTFGLGVQLGYLDRPLRLHTPYAQTFPVDHRETLVLGGALAVGSSVVVDARMPMAHQIGARWQGMGDDRPLDRWVPGDLALGARLRVAARGGFAAFLRGGVTLGTGDDHDFAGEPKWTAEWLLIARVEPAPGVVVAATGGIHVRNAEVQLADRLLGDELVGAVGATYAVPPIAGLWDTPDQLRLAAELDGVLGDRVGSQRGPSPAEARLGVIGKPFEALAVGARVGFGLDDQIGSPELRVTLELAWQPPAPPHVAPPPGAPPPEQNDSDDDEDSQ